MSLNKFDRDLDPLAELIRKTGHEEGDSMVIQFDHLIEIPFETEGIGDRRIQHPWARGVSVPIIEEYEGQMSGEAVHVEFSRDATLKFADIKQYRASFAQLDDKTVKLLWDEALKGDQFDEDDSDLEPVEQDENKMKNETIDASKIKACPKCGAVNITFNHPAFDGGSYVSCCSCNYSPQADTWAESDWEALKRWNDLPREEAPYKEEEEKHANYLHVEMPEVKIKHGTVLRDGNGNSWIFLSDNMPTPEFKPLYQVCEKVTQDGNSTSFARQIVMELPDDEEVRAEGENSAADYDANDLGLITQNAIEEDLAKLKPIVANMLQECIKHAKNQQLSCEVSVDLGGRNTWANKKAEKIEGILKSKGFDVKWRYGDGGSFMENVHVFTIKWRIPDKTQATLHQ